MKTYTKLDIYKEVLITPWGGRPDLPPHTVYVRADVAQRLWNNLRQAVDALRDLGYPEQAKDFESGLKYAEDN